MIDDETQKKDEALLHQIFVTMRLFTKAINDTIKRYNVYSSEWSVLRYLINHPSVSQTAIATALQIEPAAISKTLAKMEKKGLIYRTCKEDKREKYITLTEQGRTLYPLVAAHVNEQRSLALRGLSAEDRKAARLFINTMFENLYEH